MLNNAVIGSRPCEGGLIFFRLAGTVRFERRDGEVTRVRKEGLQA